MSAASLSDNFAETHLALHVYGAVIRILRDAGRHCAGMDQALQRWPFLAGYLHELATHRLEGIALGEADAPWEDYIRAFEAGRVGQSALRGLSQTFALEREDLLVMAACLLPDLEIRFTPVFEALNGIAGEIRPTLSLLDRWFVHGVARTRTLAGQGILELSDRTGPEGMRNVRVPDLLAQALRGQPLSGGALAHRAAADLPDLKDLVLSPSVAAAGGADLLRQEAVDVLLVRGPLHNGRRTLGQALARKSGHGVIEYELAGLTGEAAILRCRAMAAALHAVPLLRAEPGLGEAVTLDPALWRHGPVIVTLPPRGGVALQAEARALEIELPLPDRPEREALWQLALGDDCDAAPAQLAPRWRMSTGAIRRSAQGARVRAAAQGRARASLDDVRIARRFAGREALDSLANFVPAEQGWSILVTPEPTRNELELLETRIRHREILREQFAGAMGRSTAVRALFRGASGTGKTLAARALAGAVGADLYQANMAAITSKFVGETEKSLDKILWAAETLDVMLLLDEGDALLGARTPTQSANDRFANLETNFLLQRLESFQGVLVVTTNAADGIDGAFQRRMDVTIDFPAPGAEERAAIWRLHLPPDCDLSPRWLDDIAWRCALTGGQIRNAALHACLLALQDGGAVQADHLHLAIAREYRKTGTVCPLRQADLLRAG